MKEHYAKKLKKEIKRLNSIVAKYYDAVYFAKIAVKDRNGLTAMPVYEGSGLIGCEEQMPVRDYEEVCQIIENLPLISPIQ